MLMAPAEIWLELGTCFSGLHPVGAMAGLTRCGRRGALAALHVLELAGGPGGGETLHPDLGEMSPGVGGTISTPLPMCTPGLAASAFLSHK